MKNRYDHPPGLFGIGFIAAGFTARRLDVQLKEIRPVFDGPVEITIASRSKRRKSKKFRRQREW